MDALYLIIISIVAALTAVVLGNQVRGRVHQILPIHDPVLLTILLVQFVALILDLADCAPWDYVWSSGDTLAMEDDGAVISIVMVSLDLGYLLGYVMCSPGDTLMLDMPDETLTYSEIAPVVWYRRAGQIFIMPQTLEGVICSLLGARHPADIPIYEIARQRTYRIQIRLRESMATVVPVSLHRTESYKVGILRTGSRKIRDGNSNIIAEEPRYLLHVTVTRHTIRFAEEVVDDHLSFWVKNGIYQEAIEDAISSEERATRLEIQMQTARYDAGADLVKGLVSLSTDAPQARSEILERIEAERRRRAGRSSPTTSEEKEETNDGQQHTR